MFSSSNKKNADLEYFVIYDSKVGIYRDPMLAINVHDILRQVDTLFRDPQQTQNQLLTNAEDFQIFKVGSYERSTGKITGHNPEHIANLHEIRSAVQRSTLANVAPRQDRQTEHMGIVPT